MLLPVQNPFVNLPFISQEQIKNKIELHGHYILTVILRIFNGLNIEFRAHNKSGKSRWKGESLALEIRAGRRLQRYRKSGRKGGSKTLGIRRGVWIFSGITQWTRKSFCNRYDEDVCSQALITRFTIKGKAGNIVRLRTEENWKVSLIIRKYLLSLIPFVCSQ